jgi:DNA-binding protein H-NS
MLIRINNNMTLEISEMNVEQLKSLRDDIDVAIANKQAEGRANLKRKFEKEAAEAGLTLDEVIGIPLAVSKVTKEKRSVPIKYRHPTDASVGWSGRGMAPKWVLEYEANGGNRIQLQVSD